MQNAKSVAFGEDQRRKVVSKDGTLFNKAGLITGGFSTRMEEKASRFDNNNVAELEDKQEKLTQQLRELEDDAALNQKIEELDKTVASSKQERRSVKVCLLTSSSLCLTQTAAR